jgi:3-methyladenine DNA glycosylase AlkD
MQHQVTEILDWLRRHGTRRNVEGMARYGISSPRAFGVSMATMRPLQKELGRNHDLALALWDTGWLEARLLAALVDEPARVTARQMDSWVKEFDNWAVCDGACFHLFDRTPYAWTKVRVWSSRRPEFVRRAAFATIAGLAVHDKKTADARFVELMPLIVAAAADERNFVKKAVNWALRQIGKRNAMLNRAALAVATQLASAEALSARWIGSNAYRELTSDAVRARIKTRRSIA